MKKHEYNFPEPGCRSCLHHQEVGLTRYCGGFKGKIPRRFRNSDPAFKIPTWCPKRLLPMICRIYGFANERCEYMEMLTIANFNPREPYIYPIESHYKLSRELPIRMNAKQFFQAAQSEALEELLSDDNLSLGEVIEIDDGLRPYYFYNFGFPRVIPIPSFYPPKTAKVKEAN